MKALIYDGPWRMTLAEVPVPEPGPGEVLLHSVAVGICGSDVHGFTGESGRRHPGMIMGHEVVGEVVEDASGFRRGERVAVYNIHGCGKCRFCASRREQLCPDKRILGVSGGRWGGMAEQFAFPASGLFRLPARLEPAVGLLTEPVAVAIHAIGRAQPGAEDTVVIVGAGTIGLGLVAVLRARGVNRIFALDKVPEKLALIARFGATPVHVGQEDAVAVVHGATHGEGAATVFEAVGTSATVRLAYDLCAAGGNLVLVGNLAQEFSLPLQGVTGRETTIRGSYGFTRDDFAAAVAMVGGSELPLADLITGYCTLAEAPAVMTRLARGELNATKMVIRP